MGFKIQSFEDTEQINVMKRIQGSYYVHVWRDEIKFSMEPYPHEHKDITENESVSEVSGSSPNGANFSFLSFSVMYMYGEVNVNHFRLVPMKKTFKPCL